MLNGERALGSGSFLQLLCKSWHSKDARHVERLEQADVTGEGRKDPVMGLDQLRRCAYLPLCGVWGELPCLSPPALSWLGLSWPSACAGGLGSASGAAPRVGAGSGGARLDLLSREAGGGGAGSVPEHLPFLFWGSQRG